jgi:hypothetical protein
MMMLAKVLTSVFDPPSVALAIAIAIAWGYRGAPRAHVGRDDRRSRAYGAQAAAAGEIEELRDL